LPTPVGPTKRKDARILFLPAVEVLLKPVLVISSW
jgi:hypothetical protein